MGKPLSYKLGNVTSDPQLLQSAGADLKLWPCLSPYDPSCLWGVKYELTHTHTHTHTQRIIMTDPVVQSVSNLIADPGVVSLILAWLHTFLEMIDHKIFSMVFLRVSLAVSMCRKYWLTA